jgi:hypothetical protein
MRISILVSLFLFFSCVGDRGDRLNSGTVLVDESVNSSNIGSLTRSGDLNLDGTQAIEIDLSSYTTSSQIGISQRPSKVYASIDQENKILKITAQRGLYNYITDFRYSDSMKVTFQKEGSIHELAININFRIVSSNYDQLMQFPLDGSRAEINLSIDNFFASEITLDQTIQDWQLQSINTPSAVDQNFNVNFSDRKLLITTKNESRQTSFSLRDQLIELFFRKNFETLKYIVRVDLNNTPSNIEIVQVEKTKSDSHFTSMSDSRTLSLSSILSSPSESLEILEGTISSTTFNFLNVELSLENKFLRFRPKSNAALERSLEETINFFIRTTEKIYQVSLLISLNFENNYQETEVSPISVAKDIILIQTNPNRYATVSLRASDLQNSTFSFNSSTQSFEDVQCPSDFNCSIVPGLLNINIAPVNNEMNPGVFVIRFKVRDTQTRRIYLMTVNLLLEDSA